MPDLTDEQKHEVVLIASVGCDRELAARYVGCSLNALAEAVRCDAEFSKSLLRAEASAELAHMRNIQQAAREDRHWRASVWWLERRVPQRYARRDAGAVSRRELIRFLGTVANGIAAEVHHEEDRQRLLDRLGEIAETITDPLLLEGPIEQQEEAP